MSDDEKDIDVESDENGDDDPLDMSGLIYTDSTDGSDQFPCQAEKRAHHNALERKRRDHIKDSFSCLRDSVPVLHGEKASRAQILKKAADYIGFMRRKNSSHQMDIDDLKRQNQILEGQIRSLEKAKATGNFAAVASEASVINSKGASVSAFDGGSGSDSSDSGRPSHTRKSKRLKTSKGTIA